MHVWLVSVVAAVQVVSGPATTVDTGRVVSRALFAVTDTSVVGDSVAAPVLTTGSDAARAIGMASAATMDARLIGADLALPDSVAADTAVTRRPRAIEYSEAYHTRLKIHQIGAYLMIPLLVGEYILGEKLLTSTNRSSGLKTAHSAVAAGVGVVFVANTVTGVWNSWDARKDPNGRTRRNVHAALMLASDVGFLLTAASAGDAKFSVQKARTHRTLAISSIALSAIGSAMMWLWKN